MKPAISIENLGKKYRIAHGRPRAGYRTLRESLVQAAAAPLRRLRRGSSAGSTEDFWALRDVSFDVQPGEVVGIIGRNGAGKSTLLKVLSQITKPTIGRVEINGRVGSLLEVGTGFHPELTGRENVYLNGSILGMSKREVDRKFDEIVAFAEVEKFLDTPVKRYSSGMYVRLAFAVAAHLEPEILIVDEVLAVGDAQFQQKCLGKMGDLASCGRTILFVSHQMSAVQALCSHAVLMEHGRIRNAGVKHKIIAEYVASAAANSAGDWIPFESHQRSAKDRAWFTGLRFQGEVPEASYGLSPEAPAEFDVRVCASEEISPAYISMTLYDRFDTCLVRCDSGRCRVPLRIPRGESIFRISVESLHLNPGLYRVGIWMADGRVVLDSIPNAANANVNEFIPDVGSGAFGVDGAVTSRFSVGPISMIETAPSSRNDAHERGMKNG
jgi:ABC-type polysaccharide/polyol phosphate transport system ATPase subunit